MRFLCSAAVFVLCVVAYVSAIDTAQIVADCPPLRCRPSGPSFDYFKLVRQWPAGYCGTGDRCPTKPPSGTPFTLHGLWPERDHALHGHWWPECCDSQYEFQEDDIESLVPKLCRFWPSWSGPQDEKCAGQPPGQHSECFWKHEWDKHGTCSAVTDDSSQRYLEPKEYFQRVLDLHQKYDIYKALSKAKIYPSDRYTYDSRDILQALRDDFGADAYMECKGGVLTEVTTCLDTAFNLIDCPQDSRSCSDVSIPTGKPTADVTAGSVPTTTVVTE